MHLQQHVRKVDETRVRLTDKERQERQDQLQRTMQLLVHACSCKDPACPSNSCRKVCVCVLGGRAEEGATGGSWPELGTMRGTDRLQSICEEKSVSWSAGPRNVLRCRHAMCSVVVTGAGAATLASLQVTR